MLRLSTHDEFLHLKGLDALPYELAAAITAAKEGEYNDLSMPRGATMLWVRQRQRGEPCP